MGMFKRTYAQWAQQVEYTDEFAAWWDALSEDQVSRLTGSVGLLERRGLNLLVPRTNCATTCASSRAMDCYSATAPATPTA